MLLQGPQVGHVLWKKQSLFQGIGYVACIPLLKVLNRLVNGERGFVQLERRVLNWNPRTAIRHHLCAQALCRSSSLWPFSNFCPFLGLKVFRRRDFALFRCLLSFFSFFLFFSEGSPGEVQEGKGVGGQGWTATLSVDPLL